MSDGSLVFDTRIDTSGFAKGTNTLKGSMKSLVDTMGKMGGDTSKVFDGAGSKILDLKGKIEQTERQIQQLQTEMEKVSNTPFESKDIYKLSKQVEQAEQDMLGLLNQREQLEDGFKSQMSAMGLPEMDSSTMQKTMESSKGWQKLTRQIQQAEATLDKYEAALKGAQQADSNVDTTQTQAYQDRKIKLGQLINKLDVYKSKLEEVRRKEDGTASSGDKLSEVSKKVAEDLKEVSDSAGDAGDKANLFGESIGFILKMFGMTVMFQTFSSIIEGIAEGFQNLAMASQGNAGGIDGVTQELQRFAGISSTANADASMLMSSILQLKNAFATAFAPILTFVAPALQTLINYVIAAINAIGQFLAVILGGATTFTQAKKVQVDYADSLQAGGEAAKDAGKDAKKAGKDAKNALQGFDELNNLSSDKDAPKDKANGAGAGGGLSPGDMFEEVPINPAIIELIDKIKAALDLLKNKFLELKDLFMQGFKIGVGDLSVLNSIKQELIQIGKSLLDIFTDPAVLTAASKWLDTIAFNLGKDIGAITSVALTIADLFLGSISKYLSENADFLKEKIISFFNISSEIATIQGNLAVALADIFSVFRSDSAKQIGADLIAIFVNTFLSLNELALKFGRDILDMITAPIIENKDKLKDAISGTLKAMEPAVSAIKDLFSNTLSKIHEVYDDKIKPLFDGVKEILTDVFGAILDGYNQHVKPVLDGLSEKFASVISGKLQPAINTFMDLIGNLSEELNMYWTTIIKPILEFLAGAIMSSIAAAFKVAGDTILNAFGVIADLCNNVFKALKGLLDFVIGVFKGDWDRAFKGLKDVVSGIFGGIADLITGVIDLVADSITNILKSGAEVGLNLIEGIMGGINDALKGISTWLKTNLVDPIVKGVKSLFGIHSPSTVFAEIGSFLINGMLKGVKDTFQTVVDFFKEILKNIQDVFKDIGAWFGERFTEAYNTVTEIFKSIGAWFGDRFTDIKNIFSNIKETFLGIFTKALNGVQEGFKAAPGKIKEIFAKIKEIFADIKTIFLNFFKKAAAGAKEGFDTAVEMVRSIYEKIKGVFSDVRQMFKNIFDKAVQGIKDAFDGIESFFEGIWNKISGVFTGKKISIPVETTGEANASTAGRSVPVPQSFNTLNNAALASLPIPKLAGGAVIPPKASFLAVLGDQKRGTNIEAPLKTIEAAVRNVIGQQGGDIHLTINLDSKTVFETIVDRENKYFESTGQAVFVH